MIALFGFVVYVLDVLSQAALLFRALRRVRRWFVARGLPGPVVFVGAGSKTLGLCCIGTKSPRDQGLQRVIMLWAFVRIDPFIGVLHEGYVIVGKMCIQGSDNVEVESP